MTESIQAISQIAATALISSIWQGVLLAAMIWACMKLAPRTAAGIRFVIWMAVFAAVTTLPMLSEFAFRDGSAYSPASSHAAVHALLLDSRWAIGIAALWAIFSAGRAIALTRNAVRLGSLWKRCTPIDTTPAIASQLAQTSVRRAWLCTSPDVDQPCVIGFLAPRILIPDWLLEKATSAELEQIVLHEVTHLRRFDDWTNLLQEARPGMFSLESGALIGSNANSALNANRPVMRVLSGPPMRLANTPPVLLISPSSDSRGLLPRSLWVHGSVAHSLLPGSRASG